MEDGGAENFNNAGAAYIFKRDNGADTWSQVGDPLHASDKAADDFFGCSVSMSGDYIVIGAYCEDGGADNYSNAGSAYIFKRDLGLDTWTQVDILRASDIAAEDNFGYSVNISGDYLIVGATDEDGGVNGINEAGAAYIFKRDDGASTWSEVAILHASDRAAEDHFGYTVGISGNYAIVSTIDEDGGSGDTVINAGAAYIFKNNGSDNWAAVDILRASDMAEGDRFGKSVCISGSCAIIGAYAENGGDGDPATDAGAAYIINDVIY